MTELSYPMPTNAGENYIIKLWCLYRLKIAVFFEVIIVIFEISFCNCSSKWFFSGFPLVDPFAIISHLQLCNFSIQYLKKKKKTSILKSDFMTWLMKTRTSSARLHQTGTCLSMVSGENHENPLGSFGKGSSQWKKSARKRQWASC